MKAEKDKKTGKWLIQYRYTDWQGKRRKSTKRGFATKREAEEWLRNFLITKKADFDMKFADFWKMYCADMETRLREHTMRTKKYIVELKILPYFGNKRVNDITAADIRQWQNELIKMGYSPTYLKTINIDSCEDSTSNQTREWFDLARPYMTVEEIAVIENVNLITPESIHINSFMFEPLIDISDWTLKELYGSVKNL